jgi:hypothetical protein
MLARVVTLAALLTGIQCFPGYPAFAGAADGQLTEIPWPTKSWQVSTPEEQGMDSASLARLIETAGGYKQDSLMIIRHGRIVAEAYYAPYVAGVSHDLRSVTKSIVSTLTAIELQHGLLDSVDHPILDLFTDKQISNIDDNKKAMTVQSLLDMTSGIGWKERAYTPDETIMRMYRSPDRTEFVLNQPMSNPPGSKFYYNSGNPYVLSALITKKPGKARSISRRRNYSNRSASPARSGATSTPRELPTARPGFRCRHPTWRASAISISTTAIGMERKSYLRHGSNGPDKDRLRRRTAFTTQTCGGRVPKEAPSWRSAAIRKRLS